MSSAAACFFIFQACSESFTFYDTAAGRSASASGWLSGSGSDSTVMDETGVAARSGITGSTIGKAGGESDDGRWGTGGRGDTSAICGLMGDKIGEGGADSRMERRGWRSGFSFRNLLDYFILTQHLHIFIPGQLIVEQG